MVGKEDLVTGPVDGGGGVCCARQVDMLFTGQRQREVLRGERDVRHTQYNAVAGLWRAEG